MGLVSFIVSECGNNADHAFHRAVCQAQADHSVSGKTGTIADKAAYRMVRFPVKEKNPFDWAREQLELESVRSVDEPASCLDLEDGEFIFFGWAHKAGMDARSEQDIQYL
jgi:hypothetical protein